MKRAAPPTETQVPGLPSLLPWQHDDWARLGEALMGGRLPHAMLICGAAGSGAVSFAGALAARLLCMTPLADQGFTEACGVCVGCRLLAAGSHPDLHRLEPEEGHEQVRVDEARAALDFAGLTAGQGPHKVVFVPRAERLNLQAANCLLKTLEEPPAGTVFLLTTHRPARLLVTVRSRCQRFALTRPGRATALAWLEAQGVPAEEAAGRLDLARGLPLDALGETAPDRSTMYGQLAASLGALLQSAPGGRAVGPEEEALWLPRVAGDRSHDEVLPVLTLLCEDLLRLSSGAGRATLSAPAQAAHLIPLVGRLPAEVAGGWVAACYASARQSLASGLKSDDLLDTLSLTLHAVAGRAR